MKLMIAETTLNMKSIAPNFSGRAMIHVIPGSKKTAKKLAVFVKRRNCSKLLIVYHLLITDFNNWIMILFSIIDLCVYQYVKVVSTCNGNFNI